MRKVQILKGLLLLVFVVATVLQVSCVNAQKAFTQEFVFIDAAGNRIMINQQSVENSPYLTEVWNYGDVVFGSGKKLTRVALNLNIFNEELIYIENGQEYLIVEPVKEFILYMADGGQRRFRSDLLNDKVIYLEIVAEKGDLQLLKHYTRTLQERYNYGKTVTRYFRDEKSQLYLYHTTQHALAPAGNSETLIRALPAHEIRINAYAARKKKKKFQETDLVGLMTELAIIDKP